MAETIVQITEGAGKKLHAYDRVIGANTVLDEVVLLGENYLASYTVFAATGSVATAASHNLQIMAGASLKVRVRRIDVYVTNIATTAAINAFELRRLTTAGTGGTVITPAPLDTTDAASGATAMTLPTVKGTEGVVVAYGTYYHLQTIGASQSYPQPVVSWDFDRPRSKPLIIAAGVANGICVKNINAIAVGQVAVMAWIDESNF